MNTRACFFRIVAALAGAVLIPVAGALAQDVDAPQTPTGMTLAELQQSRTSAIELIELFTGRSIEGAYSIEIVEGEVDGDVIEVDAENPVIRARPDALSKWATSMAAPVDLHQYVAQLLLVDAMVGVLQRQQLENLDEIDPMALYSHATLVRGRIARRYNLTAPNWYAARILTEERENSIAVAPYTALERIYRLEGDAGLWATLASGGPDAEEIDALAERERAHRAKLKLDEPFNESGARLTAFGWSFQEVSVPGPRLRTSFRSESPETQEQLAAGILQVKYMLAQSEEELTRINVGLYELDSAQLAPVVIDATAGRLDKDNDRYRSTPRIDVTDVTREAFDGSSCDHAALFRYSTTIWDGPTARFLIAQCARENFIVEVTIQASEPDEALLGELIDSTFRGLGLSN